MNLKKGGGGVVHKSGAYDHYALTYTYTKNNIKVDRQYSSYCFLASELSVEKKIKYSRQAANSQSMGFAINISHAQ